MTPEAELFLAKARRLLDEAQTMLGVGLQDAASRAAYLAAFTAGLFVTRLAGMVRGAD